MQALLDTCVIIDFMRGFKPATAFFDQLTTQPNISTITIAELYAGAKTSKHEKLVKQFIDNCVALPVGAEIASQAGEWSRQYTPSHGVGLPDALIAATAQFHDLNLATCNLKHFPMFPELKRPYPAH